MACAKLVRRELVQSYLFCPGRVYEDNEAVCHWIYGAKTIASIPHSLYFYRTNPGSTTQSRFSMKKLDYLWALEGIIRFYSSVGYLTLRERFGTLYAEEAAGCYYRVKHELNDTKAPGISKKQPGGSDGRSRSRKRSLRPCSAPCTPSLCGFTGRWKGRRGHCGKTACPA